MFGVICPEMKPIYFTKHIKLKSDNATSVEFNTIISISLNFTHYLRNVIELNFHSGNTGEKSVNIQNTPCPLK